MNRTTVINDLATRDALNTVASMTLVIVDSIDNFVPGYDDEFKNRINDKCPRPFNRKEESVERPALA